MNISNSFSQNPCIECKTGWGHASMNANGDAIIESCIASCVMLKNYMRDQRTLDSNTIKAIETVLSKGDRAEVVPVKDGVKVLRVKRETVNSDAQ